MMPLTNLAELVGGFVCWVHSVRDVYQHWRIWNWLSKPFHFRDDHWGELPSAVILGALGTLLICWGL
jgi:hypothetical protein